LIFDFAARQERRGKERFPSRKGGALPRTVLLDSVIEGWSRRRGGKSVFPERRGITWHATKKKCCT